MFAGFPSVYLLYYYIRRRFCLIHFYCGQVKKTTLDLPSSVIVVLHLLLVVLIDSRHSGIVGKNIKKDL